MVKPLLKKKILSKTDYGSYEQQTFNFTRGKGEFDIDKKELKEVVERLLSAFMKLKDKPEHIEVAISGLSKFCYTGIKDFTDPMSFIDNEEYYDYAQGYTGEKLKWSHLSQFNLVVRLFHKVDDE